MGPGKHREPRLFVETRSSLGEGVSLAPRARLPSALNTCQYFQAKRAQKDLADLVLEHWQALPGSSHPENTAFPKPLPDTAGGPLANLQTLRCRHSTGVLGFGLRWTPGQACLLRTNKKGSCLLPNMGDPWCRGTRGMASTEQHDRARSASGVPRP